MYRLGREFFFVVAGGFFLGLYLVMSQRCDCDKDKIQVIQHALQTPKTPVVVQEQQKPSPKENNFEVENSKEVLPPCPERSPHLRTTLRTSVQKTVSPESLELFFCNEPQGPFPPIKEGGVYRPDDCQADQRVAIIIPYRNRYEHLHVQLQNLYPVLRRQQADFRFFLIEQDLPVTFNQGMLFNIGFLEANTFDQFDCFIFSDVDLLPLNDECFYKCHSDTPFQLTAAISKWSYNLPYEDYYGGIIAFTKEQFEKINGFSNLYFGWGGVDDDLLHRVRAKKYKKTRYTKDIGRFDMIKHPRDKGNPANPDRQSLLRDATVRQDKEGVNSAIYKRTKLEIKPLYTWIHVSINMTQVLKAAPSTTQKYIRTMYADAKKFDGMMKDMKALNGSQGMRHRNAYEDPNRGPKEGWEGKAPKEVKLEDKTKANKGKKESKWRQRKKDRIKLEKNERKDG